MARKATVIGYRVVIRPKVYHNERNMFRLLYGAEDHDRLMQELRSRAETIVEQAMRHVDGIGEIEIETETEAECEFCGYRWTEDDPDYNGGCCERDEQNNPARAESKE